LIIIPPPSPTEASFRRSGINIDGTIIVEPTPTADSLFGILGAEAKAKQIAPVNAYDVREEIVDDRLRELGYTPQNH
jgi:hypothetical protein